MKKAVLIGAIILIPAALIVGRLATKPGDQPTSRVEQWAYALTMLATTGGPALLSAHFKKRIRDAAPAANELKEQEHQLELRMYSEEHGRQTLHQVCQQQARYTERYRRAKAHYDAEFSCHTPLPPEAQHSE